ncbi:MAG: NAD+ synthase [Elusimicrobia bacterium]|nr:NAD+ synthase [Elusimicrobiota bacterium]
MENNLRLACVQLNCIVGDLEGNCKKIIGYIQKAKESGVDIISFPELAITGYPPEDLLFNPKFIKDNLKKLKEISKSTNNIVALVGFVDRRVKDIYNAGAVIHNSEIKGIYHKMFLPNYGVFDEERYFISGNEPLVFKFNKLVFGVNICEDIWHIDEPTKSQVLSGAGLVLNINASPYNMGKLREREKIIQKQAKDNHVWIAYTNLVGGQDELIFDGQSMIVDNNGKIIAKAEAFKEDMLIVDLNILPCKNIPSKSVIVVTDKLLHKNKPSLLKRETKPLEPVAEVYQALVLGLKDYVSKNGFQKVVIGLSGGIDSSLVASLAVDALGKDDVVGIFMPSRYSSQESKIDAEQLAQNLDIKLIKISIEQIYKIYLNIFKPHFSGLGKNITEENLQARIRGNILMAFSNKCDWLVLTTGNKSEMSVGYATLYGDMAGGFAVIKDVPKTLVYKLVQYRNSLGLVIPERVLIKEPTAELRPNQKDTDTLPPYNTLDTILKAYIEEDKDLDEIISLGFDKDIVFKVLTMVNKSEYKRRQSPPGIKITPKAFGKDRRIPITNRYKM